VSAQCSRALFVVTTRMGTQEESQPLAGSAGGGEGQEGSVFGSAAEHALLTLASILADIAREAVAKAKAAGREMAADEETLSHADE
jgi:pyruvoyl-dependent arginine decarboxylase (PvlArgDC)